MAEIFYSEVDFRSTRDEKFKFLEKGGNIYNLPTKQITPDTNNNWLTEGMDNDFDELIPMAMKNSISGNSIFSINSNGNDSGRDAWVYNFNYHILISNIKIFTDTYNNEIDRYLREGEVDNLDDFLLNDPKQIKWTRNAKRDLKLGRYAKNDEYKIRKSNYRLFTKMYLFAGKIYNKEVAQFPKIFPTPKIEKENLVICLSAVGNTKPFHCIMTNIIPDLHLTGDSQCFPFYTYKEDGTDRKENISDWALEQFREHYKDQSITKWDIFYYIYAVLHKPEYREKYAANLRRSLPRIPFLGAGSWGLGTGDLGLGTGSWGLGISKEDNYINDNKGGLDDKKLSGFGGLEKGDEFSENNLQFIKEISEGGDLWTFFTNPQSRDFHSIEYCRRTFEKIKEGIQTISLDSKGFFVGIGNTDNISSDVGLHQSRGVTNSKKGNSNLRKTTLSPDERTESPQSPIPSPQSLIFHYYSLAGRLLSDIHVNYEEQPEYYLEKIEASGKKLDWKVEKMKLSKDKQTLVYNDFLTLTGIPYEAFEYKLGNRSALEWIIDQYQIKTDKRSGIVNNPNRADEPDYIVKLIGKIITVSLETVKIVREL